jgi:serine/threonine-protein kinase
MAHGASVDVPTLDERDGPGNLIMTGSRWQDVKAVLEAALEQEPDKRAAFVRENCGDDAALRAEVESLLAAHERAGSFAERPPLAEAAFLSAAGSTSGLQRGSTLGAYVIGEWLGAGGMGEVYRARDTKLHREVALKILPTAFALDPERVARFEREAQLLASLNHPNVGAIYGLEEANGIKALVLELVEGPTLADRIARGPMPIDEALPLAKQMADALEAAHEVGVIHRDLKPANVKVKDDGTVKVLDFGLAKALEPAAPSPNLTQSPTMISPAVTERGVILGTAAYMSPEQAKGKPADGRSDLWAFGCVFYEMLTGARVFAGEDAGDTLAAVLRADPDWRMLPTETPTPIRRLLRRCLEKDRRRRLADAADARLELDEAVAESTAPIPAPIASKPVPRPLWKRAAPIAAAVLIGAVAAGSVVRRFTPMVAPSVARFTLTLPEGQYFTNTGRPVVAISPDGTRIAYVANAQLYARALWESEAKPIAGTDFGSAILNPVFSPDGQMIAFWQIADATIKRIPLAGGAAITICRAGAPFGMSWTRDDVLIGQGDRIVRCEATGGTPETIVTAQDGEVIAGPQRLPGTNAVLFTAAPREGSVGADRFEKGQVVVQSLDDGRRTVVVETGNDGRYLLSGHLVYAVGGVLFAAAFDPRSPTAVTGVPVIEGVRATTSGGAHVSVSETGSLLYVPGPSVASQRDLALLDLKGGASPLKLRPAPYEHPRLSPDGTRVAFSSDTGTEAVVWIYDLSGTTAMRRLTLVGRNRFPVWSPDGQVAFQSDREGDLGIFRQRADGTGTAERLTRAGPGTSHVPQSWSPDGRYLLYEMITDPIVNPGGWRGPRSLMILSVAVKTSMPFGDVRSALDTSATFSPDGQWVAYTVSAQATGTRTYVQPFPAAGTQYEIGVGSHPVWSPDGTSLFSSRDRGQFQSVSVTTKPTFATGNPVRAQRALLASSALVGAGIREYDIGRNGNVVGLIDTGLNANTPASASQMQIVLNWTEELKRLVPRN